MDVKAGVPQRSILGPLLFLICINDLLDNLTSNLKFLADDTLLFSTVTNPNVTGNQTNNDLHNISIWTYQWKMNMGLPMKNEF